MIDALCCISLVSIHPFVQPTIIGAVSHSPAYYILLNTHKRISFSFMNEKKMDKEKEIEETRNKRIILLNERDNEDEIGF